ncbi:MAG: hypothetical protein AAGG01_08565 [Planctomycetota bacterium]
MMFLLERNGALASNSTNWNAVVLASIAGSLLGLVMIVSLRRQIIELEGMEHFPTLTHALEELRCHVLTYSVYALPEDAAFRRRILDTALQNGLVLHFVNESQELRFEADRDAFERLLAFARYGTR